MKLKIKNMDFKKINEQLKDLGNFRYKNKPVAKTDVYLIRSGDGEQGKTDEIHEIYDLGDGVFVKLIVNSDSYGDNRFVNGIEFVKPVTKTVTDFEAI